MSAPDTCLVGALFCRQVIRLENAIVSTHTSALKHATYPPRASSNWPSRCLRPEKPMSPQPNLS